MPPLSLVAMVDTDKDIQHCILSSFVYGTNKMKTICSSENTEKLHKDLDKDFRWADINIYFSEDKVQLLRCGPLEEIIGSANPITEGEQEIQLSTNVKCLSSDATFQYHNE